MTWDFNCFVFRNIAGVLSIQAYHSDKNSFKVAFCHVQNPGVDSKKYHLFIVHLIFMFVGFSLWLQIVFSVYKAYIY